MKTLLTKLACKWLQHINYKPKLKLNTMLEIKKGLSIPTICYDVYIKSINQKNQSSIYSHTINGINYFYKKELINCPNKNTLGYESNTENKIKTLSEFYVKVITQIQKNYTINYEN
jgi:hypothetical protein